MSTFVCVWINETAQGKGNDEAWMTWQFDVTIKMARWDVAVNCQTLTRTNTHTNTQTHSYTHKEEKEDREKEEVERNIWEHAPLFYGLLPRCHVISLWPCRRPRYARTLRTQNPACRTERGKNNMHIILYILHSTLHWTTACVNRSTVDNTIFCF